MNKHNRNQQSQNGSAVVVVSIIFVVAILTTLGFVLWQNLTSKNTDPVQDSSLDKPAVALKTAQIDTTFPIPLSWNYPETWSIVSTGSGPKSPDQTAMQTFTLVSPSGDYSVIYKVGINGGRGGTCDPESAGTVQYIKQQAISGLSNGRFVEFIADAHDGNNTKKESSGYFYQSGITENSSSVTEATNGTSACFYGLGGVMLAQEKTYDLLGASIKLNKFADAKGNEINQDTIESIKAAFKTEEYTQAVNILLSTKLHRS